MPAPGVVKTVAACKALLEDYYVAQALADARQARIAVMSLGVPRQDSVLMQQGKLVSWSELTALQAKGAVGDVNLRYFDRQGRPMASDLDRRTVSLSIDEIRRLDRVVIVAGGRRKFEAVLAALQGKIADVLITDATTASRMLRTTKSMSPAAKHVKSNLWRQYHGQGRNPSPCWPPSTPREKRPSSCESRSRAQGRRGRS